MDWYPLRLTAPARPLVFGGRALAAELGKPGLPDWSVAETWEVSDVDGSVAEVVEGPLAAPRCATSPASTAPGWWATAGPGTASRCSPS